VTGAAKILNPSRFFNRYIGAVLIDDWSPSRGANTGPEVIRWARGSDDDPLFPIKRWSHCPADPPRCMRTKPNKNKRK